MVDISILQGVIYNTEIFQPARDAIKAKIAEYRGLPLSVCVNTWSSIEQALVHNNIVANFIGYNEQTESNKQLIIIAIAMLITIGIKSVEFSKPYEWWSLHTLFLNDLTNPSKETLH